jgi:hypothetical protein
MQKFKINKHENVIVISSVADPDFFPSRIQQQKKGGHKFHKIENYLIFWTGTEKIGVNWHRI